MTKDDYSDDNNISIMMVRTAMMIASIAIIVVRCMVMKDDG